MLPICYEAGQKANLYDLPAAVMHYTEARPNSDDTNIPNFEMHPKRLERGVDCLAAH